MCGRYKANTEEEVLEIKEILHEISIRINEEEKKYFGKDVYPLNLAPIIDKNKNYRICKWGFTKWDGSQIIFNARSESVNTSAFFKEHFKSNRCLVPAKCYYEWEKKANSKFKYAIHDDKIMFLAGIIKEEKDGDVYTILTKDADPNIKFIHERMPLIIAYDKANEYLEGKYDITYYINNNNLKYQESI